MESKEEKQMEGQQRQVQRISQQSRTTGDDKSDGFSSETSPQPASAASASTTTSTGPPNNATSPSYPRSSRNRTTRARGSGGEPSVLSPSSPPVPPPSTKSPLNQLIATPRQPSIPQGNGQKSNAASKPSPYGITRKVSTIGNGQSSSYPSSSSLSNSSSSASASSSPAAAKFMNATSPVTSPPNTTRKPSVLLSSLNNSTSVSSDSSGRKAQRRSVERSPTIGSMNSNRFASPNSTPRRPSVAKTDSSGQNSRYNPRNGGGDGKDVTSPRERLGRNGQPLARRPTRTVNDAGLQQYILNTRNQLGLEPERKPGLRFDPLADDDDDAGEAGDTDDSVTLPAAAVATLESIQNRERQGSRIISGAIAAQRAGKKWRPTTADHDGGLLHIAAGVVLPPLAAASVSALLHSRKPSAQKSNANSRPSSQAPSKTISPSTVASNMSTPTKTPSTPTKEASPPPPKHRTPQPPQSATSNATNTTVDNQPTVADGTTTSAQSTVPTSSVSPPLIVPLVIPAPSTLLLHSTPSPQDVALSAARRSSWEKEHPGDHLLSKRAEKIAQEEALQAAAKDSTPTSPVSERRPGVVRQTSTTTSTATSGVHPSVSPDVLDAKPVQTAASASSSSAASGAVTNPSSSPADDDSLLPSKRLGDALSDRRRRSLEQEENEKAAKDSAASTSTNSSTGTPNTIRPSAFAAAAAAHGTPSSHSNSPHLYSASPKRKVSGSNGNNPDSRGKIERRTRAQGERSPTSSPLVHPGITTGLLLPTSHLLPPPAVGAQQQIVSPDDDSSFQQSNSAQMSPEVLQDRWRRNLMKRMSVNISFAPSPFSGLLGGQATNTSQDRSPASGGQPIKGGSFSKPAPDQQGIGLVSSPTAASRPGLSRTASMSERADLRRTSSLTSRVVVDHADAGSPAHRNSMSKQNRMSINMRASTHHHVYNPPPLAVQQTNSEGAEGSQPYPQNPNFSFLFPHQELLAQQREYYDVCNKKLLDYLQWHDPQADPVIVPAQAHPNYHALLQSHSANGNSQFHSFYQMPASLPSSFDLNFWQCYSTIQNWETFDIFNFSEFTMGWPLSFMFVVVMKKNDLFARLKLDEKVAFRFIQEVESHYLPNPYHSCIHAADVLHAVYHFLNDSILRDQISDVDKFLLYFSCAIHDFAHPGVNNSFLISSRAPLAIRYNDRHVLEAFHVSSAFRMMQLTSGCNILEAWDYDKDPKVYQRCRKLIIDMVLATDLAMHFDLLRVMKGKFDSMLSSATNSTPKDARNESVTPVNEGSGAATPTATSATSSSTTPTVASPSSNSFSPATAPVIPILSLSSDDDITLVLQMLLKLGDLSHPARPKNLHLRWAELVTEEFFSQGDRERSLGLPPSMFMDRHNSNVATSQLGFLTFLVLPLFQCAGKLQGNNYWVRKVEKNLELWGELEKIEKTEKIEAVVPVAAPPVAMSSSSSSGTNVMQTISDSETTPPNSLSINSLTELENSNPSIASTNTSGVANSSSSRPTAESPAERVKSFGSEPRGTPTTQQQPTSPYSSFSNGVMMNSIDSIAPSDVSGVDLSIYPPHHPHHHGNNSSGSLSSGSGSLHGRFSSYCKDRTVLSMFQKVREIGALDDGDAPLQHEHAHFISNTRPNSALDSHNASGHVSLTAAESEKAAQILNQRIAEEPNDGSPTSPMGATAEKVHKLNTAYPNEIPPETKA